MKSFSLADRAALAQRMKTEVFDLVIIGGGITGAGAARDAASRGMKVALVESRDFAEGTSSRSSKLIHGGIRYLENFEFGLVFEALSERRLLFEIAPHLVHPLRFVLPLYSGGRVGMFKMGLGMWAYDALSMFEAPELHERLNPQESLERLPMLKRNGLLGSYVYSDAYMDDDRLVIETLRAANEMGAACLSYCTADDAEMTQGKVSALVCTDHVTKERFTIRGRHVVSTVGPWTDKVASQLLGEWKKILRPSKGIHLTFKRERMQMNQAVVMAADNDKRIVFGIPRNDMTIVGTTDTDFSDDPANVTATPADVEYLLKVANDYFPGAHLTVDDVIASYAGVRPLVDDGSESESKTSREHVIIRDPRGVTFVAGGKYTTYRLMAQQTVEAALESYSLEDRVRFGRGNTKRPLNDEATVSRLEEMGRFVPELADESGLLVADVDRMVSRHAGEAFELIADLKNVSRELSPQARYWTLEARHAIRNTMCFHLADFYFRRSHLFLAEKDHGFGQLELLSHAFAAELNWNEAVRQAEIAHLRRVLQRDLNWRESFGLAKAWG